MASKKKITKEAKTKQDFRQSKKWKDFRKLIYDRQGGRDSITGTKLPKGFHLHHRNLNATEYENIDNPDDFIALHSSMHKNIIHGLLPYIKKYHSMEVVDRLYDELELEAHLNGFID